MIIKISVFQKDYYFKTSASFDEINDSYYYSDNKDEIIEDLKDKGFEIEEIKADMNFRFNDF